MNKLIKVGQSLCHELFQQVATVIHRTPAVKHYEQLEFGLDLGEE